MHWFLVFFCSELILATYKYIHKRYSLTSKWMLLVNLLKILIWLGLLARMEFHLSFVWLLIIIPNCFIKFTSSTSSSSISIKVIVHFFES